MRLTTAEMLAIPTKRTDTVSYTPTLLQYVSSAYAEDTEKYKGDGQRLDALRKGATHFPGTLDPSSTEQLFTYYSQVTFLCSRFPHDVGITFPWYSAFPPTKIPVSMNNLNYERACVLFSAGAIMSQLGCQERITSTESIRRACHYFQSASGCFKFIRREIIPQLGTDLPPDLTPTMLDTLVALLLAQAQECACLKAVMEHGKPGTIARLASKTADFYGSIQSSTLLPPEWLAHIGIKADHFTALAQYQKANECISQAKYGEEIARLRIAEKHNQVVVSALPQRTSEPTEISFINDVRSLEVSIKRDLLRAEKDNEVVYTELVPEPGHLAPILYSETVKPTIPPSLLDPDHWSRGQTDMTGAQLLFETLMPLAIHHAAKTYAGRKEHIIKTHFENKYEDMQKEWQSLLTECDMPRILDFADPSTVPASLAACAEEVQHEGGIQALQDMLTQIQHISMKNTHLVDQGFRELEEESDQDIEMRRRYGKLWTRPASHHLTASLLKQGTTFYATLQDAQKADQIVRAKVDNCSKALALLSHPIAEIAASIPCSQDDTPEHGELVHLIGQLRTLLANCEEVQEELARLCEDARALAQADNILPTLQREADKEESDSPSQMQPDSKQFDDISTRELEKYIPLQDEMNKAIGTHEMHLAALRQAHEHFLELSNRYPVVLRRQKVIRNLEQAFVRFKEIRVNLVEGMKFYSEYADTLNQFRSNCDDFALARRMEATFLSQCDRPCAKQP